jgi:hypothetical protein
MRTRSVMEHMEHIAWDMRTAYSIDTLQSTGGGTEVGCNTEGAITGGTALMVISRKAGRPAAFRLEKQACKEPRWGKRKQVCLDQEDRISQTWPKR